MSCSTSSVIGEDFIESNNFDYSIVDTVSLGFNTIKFDSIPTSQSSRFLVGNAVGTEIGDVTSEAFFLLSYNYDNNPLVEDHYEYDSITLTLVMDDYTLYLDENGTYQTLKIEQLKGELKLADDGSLYNVSEIEGVTNVPGDTLGAQEFFLASDRIRRLEFRLTDSLGLDLFERLLATDEIFGDEEEMYEYLNGFKLSLDGSSTISFIPDSTRITIYATDNSTSVPSELTYKLEFQRAPYYNRITHSNIPEGLDNVREDEEVSSNLLNDLAYIAGGVGYATLIDLTNVKNVLIPGDEFILAGAELNVRFLETSHEDYPQAIRAQLVNEDYIEVVVSDALYLNRTLDDEYGRDNYYRLNMTTVVDFLLERNNDNQPYYLLITIDEFDSSVTSVLLGDQSLDTELIINTITN